MDEWVHCDVHEWNTAESQAILSCYARVGTIMYL